MPAWHKIPNEAFRTSDGLKSPGIGSEESIPPAYVAWRPLRQPYSYSVPSPHRLFKNFSTVVILAALPDMTTALFGPTVYTFPILLFSQTLSLICLQMFCRFNKKIQNC